jgi:hypothetical protein
MPTCFDGNAVIKQDRDLVAQLIFRFAVRCRDTCAAGTQK